MRIIAGTHKGQQITAPKGQEVRPTAERLRGALFNICQGYIEGALFLDLFAGSGAVGLEAISRGARGAVFIDSHYESIRCIHRNISYLKMEKHARVISGDVFLLLERLAGKEVYDVIYADPPYGLYGDRIIKSILSHPLLAPNGMLFIEDETGSEPTVDRIDTLELVSIRRSGRSSLQQWQKGQ